MQNVIGLVTVGMDVVVEDAEIVGNIDELDGDETGVDACNITVS